jgi:hypothetical protein
MGSELRKYLARVSRLLGWQWLAAQKNRHYPDDAEQETLGFSHRSTAFLT